MKILAVCAFGVGSSMILKLTIDKAATELGFEVDCQNTDLTIAESIDADAIFTAPSLAEKFKNKNIPIITIEKYMDVKEVKSKLKKLIKEQKKDK